MVRSTRRIDPTRPVVDNDGWEHSDITDICAIHDYTPTAALLGERYTQLTDIEQEINSLLTFDRRPKVAPEKIAKIHNEVFKAVEAAMRER